MNEVKCNICNANDYEIVNQHSEDIYYDRLDKKNHQKITTVICKKCGYVYSNPQIGEKDREKLYVENYRPIPAKIYYGGNYYKDKILNWTVGWIDKLLLKYETNKGDKNPLVLDIGSSGGHLLHALKERGWDPIGIEPTKNYAEYAKKEFDLKIIQKFFEKTKFEKELFDLIIMSNVLEHFSNPTLMLKKINKILKKRGAIYVILPNLSKPVGKPSYYFRSEHLSYFTSKTLVLMLNKCGFYPVKIHEGLYLRAVFMKKENGNKNIEGDNYKEIINLIKKYEVYYKKREKYRDLLLKFKGQFLIKLYRKFFPKR